MREAQVPQGAVDRIVGNRDAKLLVEAHDQKTVRPLLVKPDHPIPQRLTIHAADLGSFFPRAPIQHRGDRQQSPRLRGVLRSRRQATKLPAGIVPPYRAQQLDIVLLEERQHTVIEQIGRRDGRLAVVELGKAYLGVGVDEGLLVDASNALQIADIERILGAAVTWMLALESPCASFSVLAFSSAMTCASVNTRPSWALLASNAFSRFFIVSSS
jgi:hypothetical protein